MTRVWGENSNVQANKGLSSHRGDFKQGKGAFDYSCYSLDLDLNIKIKA